jgi:hypothetical protein
MKEPISISDLLRWRMAQAQTEAPAPPDAWALIAQTRPWWKKWPEQFQAAVKSLGSLQVVYGRAHSLFNETSGGHPVPAVVIHGHQKQDCQARILFLTVREGSLRLRFRLVGPALPAEQTLEVTFVDREMRPILTASATLAANHQYRIDTELPPLLAQVWEQVKVTDQMPFQFIIHCDTNQN